MDSADFAAIDAANPQRAIHLGQRVWWVGHKLDDDPFQCHVYLIENGDQSVLVDPGSSLTINETLRKIESIIPFNHIRYFICHHQDPDITAAMPRLDTMITRSDAVLLSHWRTIALLKHYNLNIRLQCVEQLGWKLDIGGRELEFIFTPYLHFPGSICTFDHGSNILFSSDIFGGFTEHWQLLATDESYFDAIKMFHEHYMPSQEILHHGLTKIERYPARLIAPQHGSIIPQHLIAYIINQLKTLDCGTYLLTQSNSDIQRLSHLNEILHQFTRAMINYKAFSEIAAECLTLVRRMLPVSNLDFYAHEEQHGGVHFSSNAMFAASDSGPPSWLVGLLGEEYSNWLNRFKRQVVYFCDIPTGTRQNNCSLAVPLVDQESKTVRAIAVFTLHETTPPDNEELEILRRLSRPLHIAVEREMIYRSLEQERQKFYQRSIRDHLTGLYTRLYMRDTVERLLHIHDRDSSATVGIIALDIDHFKLINDTYGHLEGDKVLCRIADIICAEIRKSDIPVRYGGEEFVVFIVAEPLQKVKTIAERIRKAVAALKFNGVMANVHCTISGGVVIRKQHEPLDKALQRADALLYSAKSHGRNLICAEDNRQ